jgi:hypothetical protein
MRVIVAALLSFLCVAGATAAKKTHVIDGIEWRELTKAESAAVEKRAKRLGRRLMPPARYDYFNPNVRVVLMPAAEAHELCKKHVRNNPAVMACALFGNPCRIIMPKNFSLQAALLRHEMAHCNGWPSSHPP